MLAIFGVYMKEQTDMMNTPNQNVVTKEASNLQKPRV